MKNCAIIVAVATLAAAAGGAAAGTRVTDGRITLWGGQAWPFVTWDIGPDMPGTNNPSPEGMTFYNGELWVAGDHDATQANGRLLRYSPGPGGDLSVAPGVVQMTAAAGRVWGPEGITVNTSGSGYGSFTSGLRFASVDGRDDRAATITITSPTTATTGDVVGVLPQVFPDYNDLAFVGSRDGGNGQFAGIDDTFGVRYLDKFTLAPAGGFDTQAITNRRERGMTLLSAEDAALLLGAPVTTEALLLTLQRDTAGTLGLPTANALALVDLNGNLLGSVLGFFPANNDPTTGVDLESAAWDPVNKVLYVATEQDNRVFALFIPSPGALGAFGVAGLGLAPRRPPAGTAAFCPSVGPPAVPGPPFSPAARASGSGRTEAGPRW
ncbi:MAG: hypothetical protein IBJ11_08160 [Phycisphaerales bacterium]|nr:hypothetical protein [Phycisphaerales bacterium]